MKTGKSVPTDIDDYIAGLAGTARAQLIRMRKVIRKAAPQAVEGIKYGLPTFMQAGNLVHFGAFKHHIGFYAMPTSNVNFQDELAAYETAKGSIKFPLEKPIPVDLVSRIVKFRVRENQEKAAAKRKR